MKTIQTINKVPYNTDIFGAGALVGVRFTPVEIKLTAAGASFFFSAETVNDDGVATPIERVDGRGQRGILAEELRLTNEELAEYANGALVTEFTTKAAEIILAAYTATKGAIKGVAFDNLQVVEIGE